MRAASVTALAVGLGACPESRSAVRFALHTEPRWKPDPRFQAVSPRAPGPDLARDTASVHFLDRPLIRPPHFLLRGFRACEFPEWPRTRRDARRRVRRPCPVIGPELPAPRGR